MWNFKLRGRDLRFQFYYNPHLLTTVSTTILTRARSRCPRECTRTAATQLNVYLGVTDRTAAASVTPVAVDR